jgi:hypothetical protein
MTDREAMQMALEALEFYYDQHGEESDAKLITALRERLAQPEMNQWHGLTDEEINSVRYKRDWTAPWTDTTFARAIEAKLKDKNQ